MVKKTKRKTQGITLKYRKHQIGETTINVDKKLKALTPGKRLSGTKDKDALKHKGVYYEYRRSRSDLKGKLV